MTSFAETRDLAHLKEIERLTAEAPDKTAALAASMGFLAPDRVLAACVALLEETR